MTYTPEQITAHIADRAQHVGERSKDVRILRQLLAECDAAWGDAVRAASDARGVWFEFNSQGEPTGGYCTVDAHDPGGMRKYINREAILSLTKDNSHE